MEESAPSSVNEESKTKLGKRNTTYDRDHPTSRPKRTKTEIQAAAKAKKDEILAKRELAARNKAEQDELEEQDRQAAIKEVAAAEDRIQRQQKERQSYAERPDLHTNATHQKVLEARSNTRERRLSPDADADPHHQELDRLDVPPASEVDTESDGGQLGGPMDVDEDGEDERGSQTVLSGDEADNSEGSDAFSDAAMEAMFKEMAKKRKAKKTDKGKLRKDIQSHRKVQPTVHAQPNLQLLTHSTSENTSKKKPVAKEIPSGLQKNWQTKAGVGQQPLKATTAAPVKQVPAREKLSRQVALPASSRTVVNASSALQSGPSEPEDLEGGAFGDDDELNFQAARKSLTAKKDHRAGTKSMGITLKTADTTAAKKAATRRKEAKIKFKNSHLPFDDHAQDLKTWRDSFLPAILDWAGGLEDPFGANSHRELEAVVKNTWEEVFPAYDANEAVLGVAGAAIRNWRSAIGKYALRRLAMLFANEPFKNSKEERKSYVQEQLGDLAYIYAEPTTSTGAYRSDALIEIFAVHQQVIKKTDSFFGYPTGALALCAAAHERALKLYRSGDPPDKNSKGSFVRRPWANRVALHYKNTSQLSHSKWQKIVDAADDLLALNGNDFDAAGEDDSEMDDPDGIVLSDD